MALFTARLGRGHQLHKIPSTQLKFIEESSINVISLKIRESDVGFPVNVFGTVIARDELDYKCVYMFRRESDDPSSSPRRYVFVLTSPYSLSILPLISNES